MSTNQPVWKLVANLGDTHPIDYGGLFIYMDETGTYAPEMERLECLEADQFEIHRVTLERCCEVNGYVIHDQGFAHRDPSKYQEWFSDSLESVAATMGTSRAEIVRLLCSDVVAERVEGYRMIYDHHGWSNGDNYPEYLTLEAVRARYTKGEIE